MNQGEQRMKKVEAMQSAARRILLWDEDEYSNFWFDQAFVYLEKDIQVPPHVVKALTQYPSSLFWPWFRSIYSAREELFVREYAEYMIDDNRKQSTTDGLRILYKTRLDFSAEPLFPPKEVYDKVVTYL